MKSYTITVNGNVYEVTVEEGISTNAPAAQTQKAAPVPKAAPVKAAAPVPQAPKATPAPAAPAGTNGAIKVSAPMPGKIVNVKVSVGQTVKKGEVVAILEAMKMENEIVAPDNGTVASVNATVGGSVEAGDVIVTLN